MVNAGGIYLMLRAMEKLNYTRNVQIPMRKISYEYLNTVKYMSYNFIIVINIAERRNSVIIW